MQANLDFSDGDFLGLTSESAVRRVLTEVYPFLWLPVADSWTEFQEDRRFDKRFRDLDEGEAAWWLHTRIKRLARELVSEYPESGLVVSPKRHPQFHLNFRDQGVLVFKKVTRRFIRKFGKARLERSNYLTETNKDFWQQRREAGYPDAPRLIIGYEMRREMTAVRIFVGYPRTRGRHFLWAYEMPDQTAAIQSLVASGRRRADVAAAERPELIVNPRRKDSQERDKA